MSATLYPDDTLFSQRMLKAEGLYAGRLDGIWGPITEHGASEFSRLSREIADRYGIFDQRSERNINTLALRAQQEARRFMARIHDACTVIEAESSGRSEDIPTTQLISSARQTPGSSPAPDTANNPVVKIISGTRSYAEQNRLFRLGRYHNPGPIVTHARGGRSAHNFGIAWDIGIFTQADGYLADSPLYDQAALAGLSEAVEWGGHWQNFVDRAHYQLQLNQPITLVRQRFEAGQPYTGANIA